MLKTLINKKKYSKYSTQFVTCVKRKEPHDTLGTLDYWKLSHQKKKLTNTQIKAKNIKLNVTQIENEQLKTIIELSVRVNRNT